MIQLKEKKCSEKSAGMHLLKRFGLVPDSEDVDFDRERPDYSFLYNGMMIGVEITKCLPSSILSNGNINNEQAFNHLDKILENCETVANSIILNKGYEMYVSLSEVTMSELAEKGVDWKSISRETVNEFSQLILKNITPNVPLGKLQRIECTGKRVSDLSYFRCDYNNVVTVNNGPFGGFADVIDPSFITHCLASKEKKLAGYKSENNLINEFWLQIHIPYSEIYDAYSLKGYTVESSFDRIYVTDWGGGCCRIK